ncbi:MAG: LysR family transcriptional regulator [Deltaproteobacteria bacterium]|nr:LysR family transcriptional regulator [Deltaproteobacteria bacterium]
MHWDDLRYFLSIAESGSLADAARELGVSYSTASRRLNVLEESLGVRLFDRLPAGYELTAAGKEILDPARRMEAEFKDLARGVLGRDARLAGRLRFATTDAFAERFMTEIAGFTRAYPQIEIDLLSTPAPAELAMREAEVAMLATNQPPEALVGRRLARLPSALYASTRYVDARKAESRNAEDGGHLGDLSAQAWVGWETSMRHIPAARWMRENVPDAHVACRVATGVALLAAVRDGVGIAHLICLLADSDPGLRRIRPPEKSLETSLWLLTHEDLASTGRVRVFLDYMADAIGHDPRLRATGRDEPTGSLANQHPAVPTAHAIARSSRGTSAPAGE